MMNLETTGLNLHYVCHLLDTQSVHLFFCQDYHFASRSTNTINQLIK